MTIQNSYANLFQGIQESLAICAQTRLDIENAKLGNFGTSNGGINPADESESPNSVSGPNAAGDAPSSQEANNTAEAYGLLAYIALLSSSDINNKNTNNQALIQNALQQLQALAFGPSSQPLLDPTCLQNVKAALACFSSGSSFSAGETNFMGFWNNPNVPPSGSQPVPGTAYNPMWDAFNWLSTNNYNPSMMGANPDVGFAMAMLFLAIPLTNLSALGDEGLLDHLLTESGNGLSGAAMIEKFVLDYAYMNQIPLSTIVGILPKAPAGDTVYTNFLAQMQKDAATWPTAQNLPSPSDPNFQAEMMSIVDGDWNFLSDYFPN